MRTSAAAFVLLLACACQRDYTFHTVAVYEAPRSRCVVRMEAGGVVRGGDDVSRRSQGTLILHEVRAPDHAVSQDVALLQGEVLFGAGGARGREALSGRMTEAGCAPVQEEVDELLAATEGVLCGPKGTFMDGQTKTLKVRSTKFDR